MRGSAARRHSDSQALVRILLDLVDQTDISDSKEYAVDILTFELRRIRDMNMLTEDKNYSSQSGVATKRIYNVHGPEDDCQEAVCDNDN
ncbi:Hypothetical predicted protein [Octopus vulgaris]|uniref:Uncharacterized protein n=1 Tax=Octopus vulgaris TaxID=6645 RepID=A0AA36F6N5_OCTVU|nr:Hypothetical predicted protein [Octopus vulgaris]